MCHTDPENFVKKGGVFCYPCESGKTHAAGKYNHVEDAKKEKYKCSFVLCVTCADELNLKKIEDEETKDGGVQRPKRSRRAASG